MLRTRVIPCLTIRNQGIYRTVRFKKPVYVGDPVVALKIFNEKEVDEMIILDISETEEWRTSQLELMCDIATEAFMPMCYGGKIRTMDQVQMMLSMGYEKVSLNTKAVEDPTFVREASSAFGAQSIVVSIDVRRSLLGHYAVYSHMGQTKCPLDPVSHARRMEEMGAGELLITSIDRDGSMGGYDVEILKKITDAVSIPVIAMGGAGTLEHLAKGVAQGGVSAVAAGSMFVFQGRHRAVLISYPRSDELKEVLD